MSEPTYRVELEHDPTSSVNAVPWTARVVRLSDDAVVTVEYAQNRERAFDKAQEWVKLSTITPEAPSTVFLTEDGELLDPFDRAA